jgi:hypothetical protein
MGLEYSEWEDNSASDEMKKIYFWEKRISMVLLF